MTLLLAPWIILSGYVVVVLSALLAWRTRRVRISMGVYLAGMCLMVTAEALAFRWWTTLPAAFMYPAEKRRSDRP